MKNLILYTLQKFPICLFSPPFKEGLGVVKGAKRYLALICFCLLLIACKPDREILPKNPCEGVQPNTADFEMWATRGFSSNEVMEIQDSIFANCQVYFKAKDSAADNYLWTLGLNTFYTRRVKLGFGKEYFGYAFQNTLQTSKKVNYTCFPNDQMLLSKTKSIKIVKHSNLLTTGTFKLLEQGKKDSIIIEVKLGIESPPTFDLEATFDRTFIGLPPINSKLFYENLAITNSQIKFPYYAPYLDLGFYLFEPFNGHLKVNPVTWKTELSYSIYISNPYIYLKHYMFKGRKIK